MTAAETPKGSLDSRSSKRDRETPGEEEEPKKRKEGNRDEKEQNVGESSGWRFVKNKKEKAKKTREVDVELRYVGNLNKENISVPLGTR